MDRIDFRLTIVDEDLVARFRSYIKNVWGGQRGSYNAVTRRALREFLDREDAQREFLDMHPSTDIEKIKYRC